MSKVKEVIQIQPKQRLSVTVSIFSQESLIGNASFSVFVFCIVENLVLNNSNNEEFMSQEYRSNSFSWKL